MLCYTMLCYAPFHILVYSIVFRCMILQLWFVLLNEAIEHDVWSKSTQYPYVYSLVIGPDRNRDAKKRLYAFLWTAPNYFPLPEYRGLCAGWQLARHMLSFLSWIKRMRALNTPTAIGPRQANLCLRAFRHDKFQPRMPSYLERPGIWLSVWRFLLTPCLYERAVKVLARLRGCAGSPEPSLPA